METHVPSFSFTLGYIARNNEGDGLSRRESAQNFLDLRAPSQYYLFPYSSQQHEPLRQGSAYLAGCDGDQEGADRSPGAGLSLL